MGAENMFRKVFGRKGAGAPLTSTPYAPTQSVPVQNVPAYAAKEDLHPALLAELQRLEFYERGFGRRAVEFVTTGSGSDLLAAMAPLAQNNLRAQSAYQLAKPSLHDMAAATNLAVVNGEIAPGPQVARLIAVRIAAKQVQGPYGQTPVPGQLAILGMSAMLFGGLHKLKVDYKVEWDKAISLSAALEHFRAVGGGMADLLSLLLQRDDTAYLEKAGWAASETCRDFLRSDPAALAEAMRNADPRHRPTGLKLIEHHKVTDVPGITALLVAMLTKPFNKTDRANAVSALARLDPEQLLGLLESALPTSGIDVRHGLVEAAGCAATPAILALLAMLPAVPQRYLPRLTEIAVAEKRPLRLQAMALLRDAQGLAARIESLLHDKRQPVRINAASWLADIRSTASEKALRARLKKEKSDPVRAALIVALQRLGVDLTDVIGPASLIAEADKANAKAPPKLPEWLVANRLPQVRFKDGTCVPQAVVEYWLALAIRLKDPAAHGQFGIYLDQLLPEDARMLSGWVLESWIAYDTATATLDEATAYAKATFLGHYAVFQGRYLRGADMPPEGQAALIAKIAREKLGEMVNSGSDTKGLLALACRADPVWAAGRVRWFLKKHGRRSNQAMALLEALAGTGAPAALQVVIAASARLKQKSTQARAAEIAQRYADDRGWSVDELADRTVPAAGFDDDGELDLPCGEDAKPYVARLDAALAIHLFNPDGKVVKALPAGDDDNTRESKKAFTAAKKELAQVIELQATRLFEAMCVERQWPVADWRLAFHQHPVMRRLIERLVWQGLDAEGQPLSLFRPTQEGDFTDAADNDVAIDDFAAVRLAHGALVDAETCAAWTQHLKDYEVNPFLAQFDNLRAPLTPELAEAEAITDRQGWTADSRTFRGAAEKRGYQRVMRDNGGCHEYVKEFRSHGITATIWHSGSYAVDENVPQALTELKFTKAGHRGVYRLKDVPPVLLAECWADYHAVAARGAFDPEWEKISPW